MASGIVYNVKVVTASGDIPNIDSKTLKHNFDATSFSFPLAKSSSPKFKPMMMEFVKDDLGNWGAVHLAKRVHYVHNYMVASGDTTTTFDSPYLKFSSISGSEGFITDLISGSESYTLQQPDDYKPDYTGPKWEPAQWSAKADNGDDKILKEMETWLNVIESSITMTTDGPSISGENIKYMNQANNEMANRYWAIESESWLKKDMPFWVEIFRNQDPPTVTGTIPTFLAISTGIGSTTQAYDLILRDDNVALVIDYRKGRAASTVSGAGIVFREFEFDAAKIWSKQRDIHIGFMTAAGRLIVHVNDIPIVYSRVDTASGDANGTYSKCTIAPGKIRVCGTNIGCAVNVSPMNFAPLGAMPLAVSIPTLTSTSGGPTSSTINWESADASGEPDDTKTVAFLPNEGGSDTDAYGVDAKSFKDPNTTDTPSGTGFHQQGKGYFSKSDSLKTYLLSFTASSGIVASGASSFTIPNGGTPYFFRLKGVYKDTADVLSVTEATQSGIISVSISAEAPDFFHYKKTANVTFYNESGAHDDLAAGQKSIRVEWESSVPSGPIGGVIPPSTYNFTGIVTSTSRSEVAGKETITVHCEDYIYILKNTPIINSPFYDGMLAFAAIKDLAGRAGIKTVKDEIDTSTDYFLPSGYGFTKPKMRFDSKQSLFDCIINIAKRFEAYIYFDGNGELIVKKPDDGLWAASGGSTALVFKRNPDSSVDEIIIDELVEEDDFNSTVNVISVLTVDRDTRNAIVYATTASDAGATFELAFKKVALINQSALGGLPEARAWATNLGERMFYPIRKVSFKCLKKDISPLSFVTVDDSEYRVTQSSTEYNAEDNSLTTTVNAIWLYGGAG